MHFIYLQQAEKLDNFLKKQTDASLLQSWHWGETQKAEGRKIWRLGLKSNNELIATLTVIKHNLPLGRSYLYSPRGPVFQADNETADDRRARYARWRLFFLTEIKKIAQAEKSIFWRVEPLDNDFLANLDNFKIYKTKRVQPLEEMVVSLRPNNYLPTLSLANQADAKNDQRNFNRQNPAVVDDESGQLKISEQSDQIDQKNLTELLKSMKPKTRYNIRLAEKKRVCCRWVDLSQAGDRQKNLDIFWQIIQETAQRNQFGLHPKEHYRKILEILGPQNLAGLIIAEYNKEPIAANLITFFGDTAYYLHGGSKYKYHQAMAPYLLHWQVILEACRRGLKYYNLSGVAVHLDNVKTLGGITKFKSGFGGRLISYPGTFDVVLKPAWYKIYRLYKKARCG